VKLKKPTMAEIEDAIREAGSDSLSVFGGKFEGGVNCQITPDELAGCLAAIIDSGQRVAAYLEIGVAAGGTTAMVHRFLQPDTIVLVDNNKHNKAPLRPQVLDGIEVIEIIGRSDDETSVAMAEVCGPYDLILIDGDHLYPGVKLDTVLYSPMLKPGGFLMFHDSAMAEWGVVRIVRELKKDPGFEFVGEYISTSIPKPLGTALFRRVS
jgi:predicted O-methyltransferase YrrM